MVGTHWEGWCMMARVQLIIPDEDRDRFFSQAKREGMTLSAWLRAAARAKCPRVPAAREALRITDGTRGVLRRMQRTGGARPRAGLGGASGGDARVAAPGDRRRVIFVDSNIFVYAVGREHPRREPAQAFFVDASRNRVPLYTSAEVLQELLHAYLPVGRFRELRRGAGAGVGRDGRNLGAGNRQTSTWLGSWRGSIPRWLPGISAISRVAGGAA